MGSIGDSVLKNISTSHNVSSPTRKPMDQKGLNLDLLIPHSDLFAQYFSSLSIDRIILCVSSVTVSHFIPSSFGPSNFQFSAGDSSLLLP
jgi:hypothetical protein